MSTDVRRKAKGERRETADDPTAVRLPPSASQSGIAAAYARAKAEGRVVLSPFITGGYPSLATTEKLIPALVAGGADLIELGIPFSDPMAEGPTIQHSSQVALANGTTLTDCLAVTRRAREQGVTIPIIFMGYANPFFQYGIERLAQDAAEAGVDGFIIPDLPTEESDEWVAAFRRHGRDLIFLVAPTSTDARLHDVAERASGFIYCVALTGVTGARDVLSEELPAYIARVRAKTDLPLAIGFGISRPEHVHRVGQIADGALVGAALIDRLNTVPEAEQPAAATAFIRWLSGEHA